MTNEKIIEFIETNNLGKPRIRGNELELPCPFSTCPNKGEYQFYLNQVTEAWYCQRCQSKGATLKSLAFKLSQGLYIISALELNFLRESIVVLIFISSTN